MKSFKTIVKTVFVTLLVMVLAVLALAWSGTYPVAVGTKHFWPFGWLLETTRERSVTVRASDLTVPGDLDSPERIAAGAGHYEAMCAGCHGKPGGDPADVFDPAPPALAEHRVEPRAAFWVIKHGLKMTAMPSHLDHSDAENWDTVAFVRALPEMTAEEYERLTAEATHDHDDQGAHEHGEADADADEDDHAHEIDADTPQAAVDGFEHALVEGRGQDALAYLHPDVTIVEGGKVETRARYAGGHMLGDMEFLASIEIEPLSREVLRSGRQATIISRRHMHGRFRDRDIDLVGSETATLIETDDGWRITHLAWSSEPSSAARDPES